MRKPMVLLTGASGTGKTTLAKKLSDKYGIPRMAFYGPDGAELSAARYTALQLIGKPLPYEVPDRELFQRKLVSVMADWIDAHAETGYVSDRADADQWAYTCLHGPDSLRDNPEFFAEAIAREGQFVVLCPMDTFFNLGSDPARKSAIAYHRATEGLIKQYNRYYGSLVVKGADVVRRVVDREYLEDFDHGVTLCR